MEDPQPPLQRERPAPRRLPTPARAGLVVGLLYLFLVGVGLLSEGIESLGEGFQAGLLESVTNPLAGVFAGVLATVLVQSSSVSTSTIVGLVGAGTLTVDAAVPMIMGANIGTTVTNTLAALGHVRRSEEFRRAFAGATVHDFFNLIAVAVLLPIELATGFLSNGADALARVLSGSGIEGGETQSPIKEVVKAPVGWVTDLLDGFSGTTTGVLLLAVGLAFIFLALTYITKNMRILIAGRVERVMNDIIGRGAGLVGIAVGILVTLAVQSSSITTSILIPMVAAGVLTLENAYPITLGANVGTTITALLASLAVDLRAGLVIALTHTLFNLAAIVLLYPVPAARRIPIALARRLADLAVQNRAAVVAYILGSFVILPLAGILVLR